MEYTNQEFIAYSIASVSRYKKTKNGFLKKNNQNTGYINEVPTIYSGDFFFNRRSAFSDT
jgi:hypothetical protein